jgi:phosphopantethiene--protein transferase domain
MHPHVLVETRFHFLEQQRLLSPEPGKLGDNAIHLFLFDCDQCHGRLQYACCGLSADEWQRAARFRFDRDRHYFLLVRSVLRRLLAHHLGIRPDEVRLAFNPWGKPLLFGVQDGMGLSFNVSHTHGLACIALTRDYRIGVDVERIRPVREYTEIAQSFFTAKEFTAIKTRAATEQQAFFFSLWSRKEACLKASGEGLSRALASFELPLVDELPPFDGHQAVTVHLVRSSGWILVSFVPKPGFVGAFAARKAIGDLEIYH